MKYGVAFQKRRRTTIRQSRVLAVYAAFEGLQMRRRQPKREMSTKKRPYTPTTPRL